MYRVVCPKCGRFQGFMLIAMSDKVGHDDYLCSDYPKCEHRWRVAWETLPNNDIQVTLTDINPPVQASLFAG